jgi:hypothetical protein
MLDRAAPTPTFDAARATLQGLLNGLWRAIALQLQWSSIVAVGREWRPRFAAKPPHPSLRRTPGPSSPLRPAWSFSR